MVYKRLLFGVNMVTEKFQHIIWQILKDCPGTHNIHDDIRVVGTSVEEHDKRLNQVMEKLEESGLTLNYDKCQIRVRSMDYLGNVLTKYLMTKLKPSCRHQDQRINQSCEASLV